MPADRDRLSFDPKQAYRGVVAQQGRVTLAADLNEAREIDAAENLEQALDIVGPAGTPDDGYAIGFPGGRDLSFSPGTMYVGGLRQLSPGFKYTQQPDWLDPDPIPTAQREYIYLRLEEREISAVEDGTLREVALGGPDTAQRLRLLQRAVRTPTNANDCAQALAAQVNAWQQDGWTFDPASMTLRSVARLQVSFASTSAQPDPCEPAATGGFLGAENQLIRVRLAGRSRLLWAWDNGSFLYRVEVIDATTLKLRNLPPDTAHHPRAGQVIELLRSEAKLPNGETVAAAEGLLLTLGANYNPDSQTITLPSPIGATLTPPNGTPRLYIRLWEPELAFTSGAPVALPNTGLQVTVTAPASIHTGDVWAFAVRPGAPTQIFQQRYLDAPQPPEGPRLWVCPLGIVSWTTTNGAGALVADCREKFDNLVTLSKRRGGNGCCTVTVSSGQADSLESIIASKPEDVPVKICLTAGVYTFRAPIKLGRSNVTFEACPGGVVFAGAEGGSFRFGLILMLNVSNIAFRGIQFRLPQAKSGGRPLLTLATAELVQLEMPRTENLTVAIGLRAVNCTGIEVEDCEFVFPSEPLSATHFAAGILASGRNDSWLVRRCDFGAPRGNSSTFALGQPAVQVTSDTFLVRAGFLLTHTFVAAITSSPATGGQSLSGEVAPAMLLRAEFAHNRFSGMTAAAFIQARTTEVRVTGNDGASNYSGFWLLTAHALTTLDRTMTIEHKEIGGEANGQLFFNDPVLKLVSTLARTLEAPDQPPSRGPFTNVPPPGAGAFPPSPPNDLANRFHRLFTYLTAIEAAAFPRALPSAPRYDVSANILECDPGLTVQQNQTSGPSLVLWCDDYTRVNKGENTGSATVTGNQFRASLFLQRVALLILPADAAFTGNLALNESPVIDGKRSVLVWPASAVNAPARIAITGNVLRGTLAAPGRPVAAPLNSWDVLNTITL